MPNVVFFRNEVKRCLAALAQASKSYQQTTHSSAIAPDAKIDDIMVTLEDTWHYPNEYNISELRQRIEGFLEQQEKA